MLKTSGLNHISNNVKVVVNHFFQWKTQWVFEICITLVRLVCIKNKFPSIELTVYHQVLGHGTQANKCIGAPFLEDPSVVMITYAFVLGKCNISNGMDLLALSTEIPLLGGTKVVIIFPLI